MPDKQEHDDPKPPALRGKTSEIIACVLSSSGVAGGATAAVMHAGLGGVLVVMIVPQVPSLVHTFGLLGMRWSRQRYEQEIGRQTQENHQEIVDAARKDPSNPHLRSLMEDNDRTRPDRIEWCCSCRHGRSTLEGDSAETEGLSSSPPPPTPIGRSA